MALADKISEGEAANHQRGTINELRILSEKFVAPGITREEVRLAATTVAQDTERKHAEHRRQKEEERMKDFFIKFPTLDVKMVRYSFPKFSKEDTEALKEGLKKLNKRKEMKRAKRQLQQSTSLMKKYLVTCGALEQVCV